ncbi:MAG: hypothetical protein ACRECI_05415 [Methyloceanibacter sp.]
MSRPDRLTHRIEHAKHRLANIKAHIANSRGKTDKHIWEDLFEQKKEAEMTLGYLLQDLEIESNG